MKLADEIVIRIGGEAIELRPSLRFAIRLERRPGSFSGLLKEIMDDSLTAAVEIVGDHTDTPMLTDKLFNHGLDRLREPLVRYVLALTGIDDVPADNDNDDGRPKAKPQPFHEYFAGLYKMATGWLSWPPAVALEATPAEIMLAHEGRMAMLKAIFGSDEDKSGKEPLTDDKVKRVFGGIGTTIVNRRET